MTRELDAGYSQAISRCGRLLRDSSASNTYSVEFARVGEHKSCRSARFPDVCVITRDMVICATWFLGCSGVKDSLNQRPNVSEPWFDLRRAFPGDSHETSHGFSPLLRPGLCSYVPSLPVVRAQIPIKCPIRCGLRT
jgi:hypothetical protein